MLSIPTCPDALGNPSYDRPRPNARPSLSRRPATATDPAANTLQTGQSAGPRSPRQGGCRSGRSAERTQPCLRYALACKQLTRSTYWARFKGSKWDTKAKNRQDGTTGERIVHSARRMTPSGVAGRR
ncbi:hypothetical protein BKA56DRAFT_103806 [Ilyonectria sp. MPI-CAGE-AT-0026]|nr:hypothetical protein BKA56DRAFT_103806 [Ilyonectria sp. MPI-CAGE-AT-0026]